MNFSKLDKTYFIGEIGINHNGSLDIAKKLMCAVKATGWDCAKFQKRNPRVCVPKDEWNKIRQTPWGEITYIDYKEKIEFEKKEYDIISNFANSIEIDWSASVWDVQSLKFLVDYSVPFIKVPSAKITDIELVGEISQTKLPVIISTGMSTLEEVDNAVNILLKHNNNICVMHTNSSYPTPKDELNLNMIPMLKERYGVTIGYSGHEVDLEPTCVAVALGAQVIERHITLSHEMWGTDQKASLEVHAMNMLRKRVADIPVMLGSSKKFVTKSEADVRKKLRGN